MKNFLAFAVLLLVGFAGGYGFHSYDLLDYSSPYFYQPATKTKIDESRPPEYLLISGERWFTVPRETLDINKTVPLAAAGTQCDTRIIEYKEDHNRARFTDSMWHEIFHAEMCGHNKGLKTQSNTNKNWGWTVDTEEHDVIYPLAMSQASFVHDNPEFMKWAEDWK